MTRKPAEPVSVTVDMVRCQGHGICAWVFPERLSLDPWGYAKADTSPVQDTRDVKRARRAINACPRRALAIAPAGSDRR